jgi:hypothetical protein
VPDRATRCVWLAAFALLPLVMAFRLGIPEELAARLTSEVDTDALREVA